MAETAPGATPTGSTAPTPNDAGTSSLLGQGGATQPGDAAAGAAGASAPPAPAASAAGEGQPPPLELKLPEGVDAKSLESFKALAGELKLDSPRAQKALDYHLGVVKASEEARQAQQRATFEAWGKAARVDKELSDGGKPDAFKASVGLAHQALQKFFPPSIFELLDATGLGNHPDVIRGFVRVGRALQEDSVAGAAGARGSTSQDGEAQLRSLYPDMFKES